MKLRHGQIAGKSVAGKNPVLEITVHDGNARAARVSVFSDGGEFFLARSVVPSSIFDTDETSFALLLENVVYEISGWTYAQLRQSLGLPSEDGKSAGVSRLQDF